MTKKITVGYDGSAGSHAALMWAGREALALDSEVEVLRCYPDTMGAVAASVSFHALEGAADAAKQAASAAAAMLRKTFPVLAVSAAGVYGSPKSALVEGVEHDGLIVLGKSALHGALAAILGSTPRAVVRSAPCPVVVVPERSVAAAPKRVVVGIDGSLSSAVAVNWAADEADLHRARLAIVHAWEYPYAYEGGREPFAVHDLMQVAAATALNRAVESARDRCGGDVESILVEGNPTGALLTTAKDDDLLVLGSGRPARSGLLGSTVNRVLDEAHVPVAVVPS